MIEKIFLSTYLWEIRKKILVIKEKVFLGKPYMLVILSDKTIIKFYPKTFFSYSEVKYNLETDYFYMYFSSISKNSLINIIIKHIMYRGSFNFYLPDYILQNTSLGVVFSITPKCNLKCKYCFNIYDYDLKKRNSMADLSLSELKSLFDNFRKNKIQMIILSGGEPLMYPNIVEIVDYLYSKGFYVILNTNGTILNKKLIDKLLEYPVHWMISIHERNSNDSLKWVGVKNLLNIKLKFISYLKHKKAFYIEILTILTKENISKLEKLYNFTYTYIKPDGWQFFRLFDVPGEKGSTREDMIKAIDKIYILNKKYKVNNKIVDGVPYCIHDDIKKAAEVIEGERHPSHLIKLTISPEGEVKYMCLFDEVLDNLLYSKDIKVALNHTLFKNLNTLKYLPSECQKCKYRRLCGGGSRFLAKLYTGSLYGKDPLMNF